jgi:heptosyltransferase I
MSFDPRNILVIDFGQLGDVVLSLPALGAIRRRFPHARITVAVGKSAASIVEMSGYADQVLPVDRVALRDGSKPLSIFRIMRLVKEVRGRQFDFVIDLHSLSETNLLGYLSGARWRLYARRQGRSLDFLSNFRPSPPLEDKRKHITDRYLDALAPLGIRAAPRTVRLKPSASDARAIDQILAKAKVDVGAPLVGMFPGAGNPSRRWPLARFAELADSFHRNDRLRTLVFIGPEERAITREMRAAFGSSATLVENLTLPQLAAALNRLSVLVSNDTGPAHVAAVVGTPVVVVIVNRSTPDGFEPLGDNHQLLYGVSPDEISVERVYEATRAVFTAERTASLFAE